MNDPSNDESSKPTGSETSVVPPRGEVHDEPRLLVRPRRAEHELFAAPDQALHQPVRLGRWVRLEDTIEDTWDSVTEILRAVCAGELTLDDVTPAGVGAYFSERGSDPDG